MEADDIWKRRRTTGKEENFGNYKRDTMSCGEV
jgi:hypothetical protein